MSLTQYGDVGAGQGSDGVEDYVNLSGRGVGGSQPHNVVDGCKGRGPKRRKDFVGASIIRAYDCRCRMSSGNKNKNS